MSLISDTIEEFLKELFEEDLEDSVTIKRNELAGKFHCAPSQINYVLSTRFNVNNGYVVESQRGGGGYIRIIRLHAGDHADHLLTLLNEEIAETISEREAVNIIEALKESGLLSGRETSLLKSVVSTAALGQGHEAKRLRAGIMKQIICVLMKEE